ncbi:MAG: uroporphyrinogen decarboxylase [Oscillospiraceae bacterium]|nr:uroporphyrinogen decarboxylase [Oscillospiraceae bacterium]
MATLKERTQIRTDSIEGRIPKRVFVFARFSLEAACGYAGVDLAKAHYDMELTEKAFESICKDFYSDALPVGNIRFPAPYQILGARNWVMGSNGAVQHPEIVTMEADEYDEYIANPYDAIVEKFLPRACPELDTDPANRSLVLGKAYRSFKKYSEGTRAVCGKLAAKYGLVPGFITGELIEAPFDFLADQLRGFKEINIDLRRRADKVKAACEATLPLMLKRAVPPVIRPGQINYIPLHLAPYIKMGDFEKYFWPTLEELVNGMDKAGVACTLFAEEDWTRYAEYLARLPKSAILMFENGDCAKIKATAGKDHLIGGFFDPTITLTRSKEECIDEAKRLVDICAPGGNFYFAFDKGIMDIKSVDVPKLQAVLEWVSVNTNY